MNDTVSIIIPVYNNEMFVRHCIDSIISQTYTHLQIIVIDDGSSDSSYEVLKEYAGKDARIELIHQENLGVAAARNVGVDRAKGKYITFVDGDDYLGSDYIEKLVHKAHDNDAQMVICGLTMVTPKGDIQKKIVPGDYVRFTHEEWTFRISAVAAHMYKTELWRKYKVRFVDGERGEDMPISLFFAGICSRIVTLSESEYYYVQHEQSAMHRFKGLADFSLPYSSLEQYIIKLNDEGIVNSIEFHELFVMRILATFIQLSKGAKDKEKKKLADYIKRIVHEYYPCCHKNKMTRIFSDLDIPLYQKMVVKMLVVSVRMNIIDILINLAC